MQDEEYMRVALKLAEEAYKEDEVPIGCIIVQNGEIIAESRNLRNTKKSVLGHAEIGAISQACEKTGDWRLEDCELYVTVEPCPMCAGAILQARIPRVIFGAANKKAGCCGSILNILDDSRFNHRAKIVSGVLESECSEIMTDFFRNKLNGASKNRQNFLK